MFKAIIDKSKPSQHPELADVPSKSPQLHDKSPKESPKALRDATARASVVSARVELMKREIEDTSRTLHNISEQIRSTAFQASSTGLFAQWAAEVQRIANKNEDVMRGFQVNVIDLIDTTEDHIVEAHPEEDAAERKYFARARWAGLPRESISSLCREQQGSSIRGPRRPSEEKKIGAKSPSMKSLLPTRPKPPRNSSQQQLNAPSEAPIPQPKTTAPKYNFWTNEGGSTFLAPSAALTTGSSVDATNRATAIASSLYVILDAVMRQTSSEKAAILVPYKGDLTDLRGVSATGTGPDTKLADVRIRDPTSEPFIAMQARMMVSCCRGHNPVTNAARTTILGFENEASGNFPIAGQAQQPPRSATTSIRAAPSTRSKQWSSLSVPIWGNSSQRALGILYLANKRAGNAKYELDDEHFAYGVAQLIASVFDRFDDYEMLIRLYDPKLQLPPVKRFPSFVAPPGNHDIVVFRTWDPTNGKEVRMPTANGRSSVRIMESSPVMSVGDYILRLQRMWKEAVELNLKHRDAHEKRTVFIKKLVARLRLSELRNEALTMEKFGDQSVDDARPSFLPPPEELAEIGRDVNDTPDDTKDHFLPSFTQYLGEDDDKPLPKKQSATNPLQPTSPLSPAVAEQSKARVTNSVSSPLHVVPLTRMGKQERAQRTRHPVKYKIGKQIGEGENGVVFSALIEQTGEIVAAKRIMPRGADMNLNKKYDSLSHEISVLKTLEHPNIVRYLFCHMELEDPDGEKGALVVATEYVAGGSLAGMLQEYGGKLSERTASIFAAQLLLGLEYLHAKGIIHRDIKPANCLVSPLGEIKLSDFGLAQFVAGVHATADDKSQRRGTPFYMSPEVIRGEVCGWQADIWAFACTLMELLTGKLPWSHVGAPKEILRHVVYNCEPLDIPVCGSPAVQEVLNMCLQRDPTLRPTTTELLGHKWFKEFDVLAKSTAQGDFGSLRINPEIAREASVIASSGHRSSVFSQYSSSIDRFFEAHDPKRESSDDMHKHDEEVSSEPFDRTPESHTSDCSQTT